MIFHEISDRLATLRLWGKRGCRVNKNSFTRKRILTQSMPEIENWPVLAKICQYISFNLTLF